MVKKHSGHYNKWCFTRVATKIVSLPFFLFILNINWTPALMKRNIYIYRHDHIKEGKLGGATCTHFSQRRESSSRMCAIFGIVASQLHVFRQTEKWSKSRSAEKARFCFSDALAAARSAPVANHFLSAALVVNSLSVCADEPNRADLCSRLVALQSKARSCCLVARWRKHATCGDRIWHRSTFFVFVLNKTCSGSTS